MKTNYPAVILVVLLVGIIGYFGCLKITSAYKLPVSGKVPTPISNEQYIKQYQQYLKQYLEFLKSALMLNIRIKEDTVWIYITNQSSEALPSEKPYRVIVCSTELIDLDNKLIGCYPEYFKMEPLESSDKTPSQQIAPVTTIKFGYDLTIPHGIIRIKLTYEDFSIFGRGEDKMPSVSLAEQEIIF